MFRFDTCTEELLEKAFLDQTLDGPVIDDLLVVNTLHQRCDLGIRLLIDDRFTVESWWRTGGIERTLGIVYETSFTYFERGNQIVIQMLEELSNEKSDCA